jgi:NADH-quinone oxidoreductase subunit N
MIPPLSPEFFVVCLGIFLLMQEAFSPKMPKAALAWIGIGGLLIALVGTFFLAPVPLALAASGFYETDAFGLFFKRFMLVATMLTLLASVDYAPFYRRYLPASKNGEGLGEYYILPIFCCAGLMWLASAADFIMIFVSLELVTITFYVLVASMRKHKGALEAGVKYLILGALSTGFLVYGITWIFGMTGQTSMDGLADILPDLAPEGRTPLLFGFALVVVALGFKIAAFPFQFWVPDVYQGAPTPTSAYLSVASKAAGFVVLIRIVQPFLEVPAIREKVLLAMAVLAGATLLYGNLAAMPQTNFKRLLAYSSIAHAGYLLLGVASVTSGNAGPAIGFYLAGYLIMTFSAFLVLILVSGQTGAEEIADFNGLSKRSPFLAFSLMLSVLSLAGLPFTVGFLGKFLIFESAVRAGLYVLVGIGVITVASGFYYYFKVIRAAYWQPASENAPEIVIPAPTKFVLGLLSIATIVFGIFPQPILAMLK